MTQFNKPAADMPEEIWIEETPNMRPWNTTGRGVKFLRADLATRPTEVTVDEFYKEFRGYAAITDYIQDKYPSGIRIVP